MIDVDDIEQRVARVVREAPGKVMKTPVLRIRPAQRADHASLVELWERSARAAHRFLTERDIMMLRPAVAEDAIAWWVLVDDLASVEPTERRPIHAALRRNSMDARTFAGVITCPVFGRIASSPRSSARNAATPSSGVQN